MKKILTRDDWKLYPFHILMEILKAVTVTIRVDTGRIALAGFPLQSQEAGGRNVKMSCSGVE